MNREEDAVHKLGGNCMPWETFQEGYSECSVLQCGRGGEQVIIPFLPKDKVVTKLYHFLRPLGQAQNMYVRYTFGDDMEENSSREFNVQAGDWVTAFRIYQEFSRPPDPLNVNILKPGEVMAWTPFVSGRYRPNGEVLAVGPFGIEDASSVFPQLKRVMYSRSVSAQTIVNLITLLYPLGTLKTVSITSYSLSKLGRTDRPLFICAFLNKGYKQNDFIEELNSKLLMFAQVKFAQAV